MSNTSFFNFIFIVDIIANVLISHPFSLPTSTQHLPPALWPLPHCYLCLWIMNICFQLNLSPSFHLVIPLPSTLSAVSLRQKLRQKTICFIPYCMSDLKYVRNNSSNWIMPINKWLIFLTSQQSNILCLCEDSCSPPTHLFVQITVSDY